MLVELAPEQLVDPGLGASTTTVELAAVARQCGVQALPGGDHPGCQVGRQLAGARFCRQVAQVMVILYGFVHEACQSGLCFVLARRPVFAQGARWFVEAIDVLGNGVAGDTHGGLALYPRCL
ncbi:hypothetical protein D3C79_866610 [compost metagenome]